MMKTMTIEIEVDCTSRHDSEHPGEITTEHGHLWINSEEVEFFDLTGVSKEEMLKKAFEAAKKEEWT